MDAAQAKENIKPYGMVDSVNFKADSEIHLVEKAMTWATAKGYLMALSGPEVRELVEVLKNTRDHYLKCKCVPFTGEHWRDCQMSESTLVLSKFREASKV